MISGSDFHQNGDEARGGIETKLPISSIDSLIKLLKNKNGYELIIAKIKEENSSHL